MNPIVANIYFPDVFQTVTDEFIKLETPLEDGENPIKIILVEVVCSESQGEGHLDVIPSGEHQDDFDAGS